MVWESLGKFLRDLPKLAEAGWESLPPQDPRSVCQVCFMYKNCSFKKKNLRGAVMTASSMKFVGG